MLRASAVVAIVAAAKLAPHALGWELLSMSALLSGIVAVNAFLMGVVLADMVTLLLRIGLMADVTPPVGLASYAAAGIANCDPMRAGLTACVDREGREIDKGVLLPLGPKTDNARTRLAFAGIGLLNFGDTPQIASVQFGSRAEQLGLEPGFTIESVQVARARPAKEWLFIPALALLAILLWRQHLRRKKEK